MSDGDFPNAAAAAHDRAWTVLEEGAAWVMDRSRRFTLDEVCGPAQRRRRSGPRAGGAAARGGR